MAVQFAEGVRRAIECGVFGDGDVLPPVKDWAAALGCSVFVPRRGMGMLAEKGVLTIKKHVGAVVNRRMVLRGNAKTVIYVSVDNGDIWTRNVFTFRLKEVLEKAGIRFRRISVGNGSEVGESSELKEAICDGVDFALCEISNPKIAKPFVSANIPYAVIATGVSKFPGAVTVFRWVDQQLMGGITALLRDSGCRSVMHFGFGSWLNDSMSAELYAAGIRLQRRRISSQCGKDSSPACWQQSTLDMFESMLSAGKGWLPDALLFSDDYIAAGALLALTHHSVEIPEDVKVITLSNKGLGPVFFRPLTRFEVDHASNAELIGAWLCKILNGKPIPPPSISAKLIRGDTL